MAHSSECTDQYAQKALDGADIVREAMLRQQLITPYNFAPGRELWRVGRGLRATIEPGPGSGIGSGSAVAQNGYEFGFYFTFSKWSNSA
jgi:hypothetical protein